MSIVIQGMGSSALVTQGYGLSIVWAVVVNQQVLHGYNKFRTLQWGGPYKP